MTDQDGAGCGLPVRPRAGRIRALAPVAAGALVIALAAGPATAQTDDPSESDADAVVIAEPIDGPYFVTWVSAAVRAEPDAASERLATLDFGDQIFVTGRVATGPWYRVELDDGAVGYVWQPVLEPMRVMLPGGDGAAPGEGGFVASADNSMDAAQPLGLLGAQPITRQAFVGPEDVSDFYSFEVSDWTELEATLTGLQADADITLLDGNGEYMTDSAAAGSSDEAFFLTVAPGFYFIEVYMYEGETPYSLTLTGLPGDPPPDDTVGDEPAAATDLGDLTGGGATVSEWVGPGDPADVYAFSVTERSTVTVTMGGLSDDADISLEDDFGTVLASSAEGGSSDEWMETQVSPGTYYVVVVPFSGSTDYEVSVAAVAAGPMPEDNAGNSVGEARPVTLTAGQAETFSDWVGPGDEQDFYAVTVDAPQMLTVELSGLASDVDVELLDGDGSTVLASSLNPGREDEWLEWSLMSGTYYVRVYVFDGQSTYSLDLAAGS